MIYVYIYLHSICMYIINSIAYHIFYLRTIFCTIYLICVELLPRAIIFVLCLIEFLREIKGKRIW